MRVLLERHPLSQTWGDMPPNDFAELQGDIEKHGLRYPIVIYGGLVLDGWHRYRACTAIDVTPKTEKFNGTAEEASDLVTSLNAHRRNLSESQRAFAIISCNQWVKAHAQGSPGRPSPPSSKTNAQLAALAGTSQDTIIRAKKVHTNGSALLKKAVQSGDVSVKKAAAVVSLRKSEQLAAATAVNLDERWQPDADEEAAHALMERELAESLDKILKADDRLAAAHAEIKRQAAEIAVLKLARDGYLNARQEVIKRYKAAQRQLERLEHENDRLRARGFA